MSASAPRYQPSQSDRPAPPPPPRRQLDAKQRFLWELFQKVDSDKSGAINAIELQSALSNGTWTPFNSETIRIMIAMFDKDNSSAISFDEFGTLWKYIDDWQACFKSFDKDGSGSIDRSELKLALTSFGYNLSGEFYSVLINKIVEDKRKRELSRYSEKGVHLKPNPKNINTHQAQFYFDDFILFNCKIQTLTSAFKQYDYQRSGVITIKYEDFLTLIFSLNI